MAFIDVYKSERIQRTLYGISSLDGAKVLILTWLLNRVTDLKPQHALMGLFQKYNKGALFGPPGAGFIGIPVPSPDTVLTETVSKTIQILEGDLPPGATLEDQIAQYLNDNNLNKGAEDAELWVEII